MKDVRRPLKPDSEANGAPAVRTVFFGSGAFAVPILDMLAGRVDIAVVGVVTPPDRPAGRHGEPTPVPVAVVARRLGLTLLQVGRIRSDDALTSIRGLAPDLGVLADFGQIVPPALLDLPRLGILNVHPSLLPRHRGASPIAATILAGDEAGGVAIMQMDTGLDTGPVIARRSWPLAGTEDAPTLAAQAAIAGAGLLAEVLPAVLAGRATAIAQDDRAATLTRPFRRVDGRLDPRNTALALERQVRAHRPWPGSFLEVGPDRIVVLEAEIGPADPDDSVGTLVRDGHGLAVVTTQDRLRLVRVQPAGGRPMTIGEFLRGRPDLVGAVVSASGPTHAGLASDAAAPALKPGA